MDNYPSLARLKRRLDARKNARNITPEQERLLSELESLAIQSQEIRESIMKSSILGPQPDKCPCCGA